MVLKSSQVVAYLSNSGEDPNVDLYNNKEHGGTTRVSPHTCRSRSQVDYAGPRPCLFSSKAPGLSSVAVIETATVFALGPVGNALFTR